MSLYIEHLKQKPCDERQDVAFRIVVCRVYFEMNPTSVYASECTVLSMPYSWDYFLDQDSYPDYLWRMMATELPHSLDTGPPTWKC
jgi:hypothetical protein